MKHSSKTSTPQPPLEQITINGVHYADVIRAEATVGQTTFISPPESSFQFGWLAHTAGHHEPAHYHKEFSRTITDLQQMFVVQRGVVAIELYDDDGGMIKEIILNPGDAIVLIHGSHALRVLEDMQCLSVKQGPFLGTENDKVMIEVKK